MSIKTTKPVENAEKLGGRAPEYYIPERIENKNGTAIKFADGTLICTKTLNIGDLEVTLQKNSVYIQPTEIREGAYAVPFIGTKYRSVEVALTNTTNTPVWASTLSGDTIWVTASSPLTLKAVIIYILAIGKWK